MQTARLAAERRSPDDLIRLQTAFNEYEQEVNQGKTAIDQDLMFHLKIAEASKNDVLKSLMLLITPDILRNHSSKDVCADGKSLKALEEHQTILAAIQDHDIEKAEKSMKLHLQDLLKST